MYMLFNGLFCVSRKSMDQNVEDKKLEECFTRPGFMALWTKLPVKLLSLNVVAEMVAVTRMSCEDRAGETDLKAYCMNYVGNNYERDAPARGVRVFTATAGGASGRSAKEFYMCFAPDADTSCLKSLLAVQRLKHDFEDPASKYEPLSFAVDMYARSAHAFEQASSLASEVLGLGELGQARPNKNDVQRLLKRIANIDNVSRSILALSSSGKPPPPRAGSGSTRGRRRTPSPSCSGRKATSGLSSARSRACVRSSLRGTSPKYGTL